MNKVIEAICARYEEMDKNKPYKRQHNRIKAILCHGDLNNGQWQVTAPIGEDIKPEEIEALFADYDFNWKYPSIGMAVWDRGVAIVNTHGKREE